MKPVILFLCLISLALGQECYPNIERTNCHPDADSSEERCVARGCQWCPTDERYVPWCQFPKSYGYRMVGEPNITTNGFIVELTRTSTSTLFGGDSDTLFVEADYQSDYRLRIKIHDGTPRWEVPLEVDPPAKGLQNPLYEVEFSNDPVFSFKVIRKSTGTVLFDTSLGPLIFSNQFIEIGIKVPSKNVYGIGENEQFTFRHNFEGSSESSSYQTWPLFANGPAPNHHVNLYGVHPHYTVLENDGNSHAVVIVNSNAQEFEMHPTPGIIYRTIGGILDMYIFLGPTPENTVQQYTEAVGRYPLPPYWSLGYQLCRHGYDHIDKMKAVVQAMIDNEIPYDVQYADIDTMDRELSFTISQDRFEGLPELTKELKAQGIKMMTILEPCVSSIEPPGTYRPLELGNEMDVWVKRPDGTPFQGQVWTEGACHYPDFSKNSTHEWWATLIKEFHDLLEFEALWIDMNEPANFRDGDYELGCDANSSLNHPPYYPHSYTNTLFSNTVCMDAVDSRAAHYNTHNLFGWTESEPTLRATTAAVGKRTFALSRSTFLGSGRWVAHWLGDNFSSWSNLHYSIIGMLQFNLFGIPFVGVDICGHNLNCPAQLCQRWHQLGAFYPFARNHNAYGNVDQDPTAFNGTIIESTRKVLNIRYTLLPYLYTLMAIHEMEGNTVARALWHEFPTDAEAAGIDRQFLWGSGLLITPVLEENATTVRGYFPDARFFDYYTGEEIKTRGGYVELDAPLDHINLHIRGGNIIPTQEPAVNTERARENPLGLIIAMDDMQSAEGTFYYDAGDNLNPIESGEHFQMGLYAENGMIAPSYITDGYPDMAKKYFGTIRILGLSQIVSTITVNGVNHKDFLINPKTNEVYVFNLMVQANQPFLIEYV